MSVSDGKRGGVLGWKMVGRRNGNFEEKKIPDWRVKPDFLVSGAFETTFLAFIINAYLFTLNFGNLKMLLSSTLRWKI